MLQHMKGEHRQEVRERCKNAPAHKNAKQIKKNYSDIQMGGGSFCLRVMLVLGLVGIPVELVSLLTSFKFIRERKKKVTWSL